MNEDTTLSISLDKEILDFITLQKESNIPRSQWFYCKHLNLYLRAGAYHLDHETLTMKYAIGIANVLAVRRAPKGGFKKLIVSLEVIGKELGYEVLRCEEVHSPTLLEQLYKNGYALYAGEDSTPILFKVL